jgi:predicted phage-related endonuclease
MALTPSQVLKRRNSIGGSDMNIIMSGDMEKISKLWKQKRGDIGPEDLSNVLPVRMGSFTEPFNIEWFQEQTGRIVTNMGDERVHPSISFLTCTLDGLTDDGLTVFEAKHVSAFSKDEDIVERYMPQLHHNMNVCGVRNSVLSVFYGTLKWERYDVPYDQVYGDIVQSAAEKFWESVQNNEAPELTVASAPKEATKKVDMTGNNEWAYLAGEILQLTTYKRAYDLNVAAIKTLIEPDVIEAFGYGISFKRDKRGALRMKGEKE